MSESAFATLWIGPGLDPYEELHLKSFANCGYAISVYSCDTDLRLHLGVQWKGANLVVPSEEVFDNPAKPRSFALFAKIFVTAFFDGPQRSGAAPTSLLCGRASLPVNSSGVSRTP